MKKFDGCALGQVELWEVGEASTAVKAAMECEGEGPEVKEKAWSSVQQKTKTSFPTILCCLRKTCCEVCLCGE